MRTVGSSRSRAVIAGALTGELGVAVHPDDRRIRFDGNGFTSPAAVYPWTVIDYSWAKLLVAPGQRLGYLALSPGMPSDDSATQRELLFPTQVGMVGTPRGGDVRLPGELSGGNVLRVGCGTGR